MKPQQMRTGARAAGRTGRAARPPRADRNAPRERPVRETPTLHEVGIDEDNARRACAPMGTLQSIVVSRSTRNTTRTYYVIVPDPATEPEYAKRGLQLEPGCRVLVDAAALEPLAVLSVTEAGGLESAHAPLDAGIRPRVDLPGA